jgi:hypothetical protein
MEDWAGQEGIKLSTEHSGKSQLNLGCLVNSKLEYLGEGYELRSSGWGALRAGKGVMVTTYDRPGASGQQLDMQETIAQLESALATAKALAASASGPMSLIADKDVNLASVNRKVNLAAAKEIILECGGAFIQFKDGSITFGGPGDLFLKTITVQKQGKA